MVINMDPQLDNVQRTRHLGTLSCKPEVFVKVLGDVCGKIARVRQKAASPRHNRTNAHMNSQRLWQ